MSVLKTFYGVRHVKENWNGAKLYDKVFFPASIWRGFSKCNLAFRKMNWKILRKSHKNSIKSGISESTVKYCGWSFDFGFCVKCSPQYWHEMNSSRNFSNLKNWNSCMIGSLLLQNSYWIQKVFLLGPHYFWFFPLLLPLSLILKSWGCEKSKYFFGR